MATTPTEPAERREGASPAAPTLGPGQPPPRRSKSRRLLLFLVILAVLIAVAIPGYRYIMSYESTDDAEIDGYIYPVSARIPGYVVRVTVDDNQSVQAGTVLAQLDPKDYQVAVANAKATFANLGASSEAARINVPLTSVNTSSQLSSAQADVDNAQAGLAAAERQFDAAQATLREAEANDLKAQDDVNRYKPLAAKDEIAQQTYTQSVDTQKATAAAVEAAKSSAAAADQNVTAAHSRVLQAQAELHYAETRPQQISVQRARAEAAEAQREQAQAALDQAQLNLQYTTVVAPVSGIVGQRSVQPGQNVSPGQQLMTIVPLDSDNIWVTANFKETQLNYMRPGQAVKISVDTYDRSYDGHVLNIAGASGALYSLLPPENATGNYVKVVQRIPVKIVFEKGQDPEHLLRPGMSVEPKVKVK
jgi:membrane fusion protein (multidrug efflux system)